MNSHSFCCDDESSHHEAIHSTHSQSQFLMHASLNSQTLRHNGGKKHEKRFWWIDMKPKSFPLTTSQWKCIGTCGQLFQVSGWLNFPTQKSQKFVPSDSPPSFNVHSTRIKLRPAETLQPQELFAFAPWTFVVLFNYRHGKDNSSAGYQMRVRQIGER